MICFDYLEVSPVGLLIVRNGNIYIIIERRDENICAKISRALKLSIIGRTSHLESIAEYSILITASSQTISVGRFRDPYRSFWLAVRKFWKEHNEVSTGNILLPRWSIPFPQTITSFTLLFHIPILLVPTNS